MKIKKQMITFLCIVLISIVTIISAYIDYNDKLKDKQNQLDAERKRAEEYESIINKSNLLLSNNDSIIQSQHQVIDTTQKIILLQNELADKNNKIQTLSQQINEQNKALAKALIEKSNFSTNLSLMNDVIVDNTRLVISFGNISEKSKAYFNSSSSGRYITKEADEAAMGDEGRFIGEGVINLIIPHYNDRKFFSDNDKFFELKLNIGDLRYDF